MDHYTLLGDSRYGRDTPWSPAGKKKFNIPDGIKNALFIR
jgi:hypothetical protein